MKENQLEFLKREISDQAKLGIRFPDSTFNTFEKLNLLHDDIHRLIMKEADIQLRELLHPPSFSYCWVEMGSGGRSERTLWTDQDNGIIYLCKEEDQEEVVQFLTQLAERVVRELSQVGYPFCNGNVMATNPRWMQSLNGWKKNITAWCEELTLDHIRFLLIAADLRPMYGEVELAEEVREWIYCSMKFNSTLKRLAKYTFHHELPIGLLGRVFTNTHGEHAGLFSIKEGGYYQLISMIRVLSFGMDVKTSASSTRSRIKVLSPKLKNSRAWENALAYFLHLRLKNHTSFLFDGIGTVDYVDLRQLPKEDIISLKGHLQFLKEQQKYWMKVFEKRGLIM